MNDDEVLTLPEIATMLSVNPSTVRLWVSQGRLAAHMAGGRRWLVYRGDLEKMLAAQPTIGKPRTGVVSTPEPKDWSAVPEQASLDLASSTRLTRGTQ